MEVVIMNINIWIWSLPVEIQEDIRQDLVKYFVDNHDEMTVLEVADHVSAAMVGRLSDLDGVLDIGKYMDRLIVLERDLKD